MSNKSDILIFRSGGPAGDKQLEGKADLFQIVRDIDGRSGFRGDVSGGDH